MNFYLCRIFSLTVVIVSLWFQGSAFSVPIEVSSLAAVKGFLFAGTYSGKIFMSQDSGLHWSDASVGLCDSSKFQYQKTIKCIKVSAHDSIHAVTACGEFVSVVPEIHWKQLSADSCIYGYCSQCIPNKVYSVAVNEWKIKSFITGPIEWSQDSGKTWTVAVPGCSVCSMPIIQSLYFDTISALAGLYDGYGSQIGFKSSIITSIDSGRTWRATGLSGISGISSITRMGPIAFASSEKGIYASRDNFKTWWVIGESSRCASGAAQPQKPSLLLKEIRQNGKPYWNFTYDSLGRMIADNAYTNESYTYDSLGRLSKRFYAGFEVTYQYGIDGALSSMTEYYPATNKTWMERYRRGSDGAIIDALTFYNGDTTGYVLYAYDCAGNTIERNEYNKNGTLFYQEKCTYDSLVNPLQLSFPLDMVKKGNMVYSYYYSVMMSSPPKEYSSSFEYDASGLPLRETRVRTNIKDTLHYEYIYDKKVVGTFKEPSIGQKAAIAISKGTSLAASSISLNLSVPTPASISLCDLSGRRIAVLLKPTTLPAGTQRIPLSLNEKFVPHAGGIFMCVVKVGGVVETFRIPVIR